MNIKRAKQEIRDSIEAYLSKDEFGEYRGKKYRSFIRVPDLSQDLSCGDHVQYLLFLSQKSETGDFYWKSRIHFCGMDYLCVHETSLFFQSDDLSAAGTHGH